MADARNFGHVSTLTVTEPTSSPFNFSCKTSRYSRIAIGYSEALPPRSRPAASNPARLDNPLQDYGIIQTHTRIVIPQPHYVKPPNVANQLHRVVDVQHV